MSLKFETMINTPDSPVFLSTEMMKDGHILKSMNEKVRFILQQLNNEEYVRYATAPGKIQPTLEAVGHFLVSQIKARKEGKDCIWYVYDQKTKSCCGLISIKETANGQFEIGQLAKQTDYAARFSALKMLEEHLMKEKAIKKLSVKITVDNMDVVYHSSLRNRGYHIEKITYNRVLNLDDADYVVYSKKQKNAFDENIKIIGRFPERILPFQQSIVFDKCRSF